MSTGKKEEPRDIALRATPPRIVRLNRKVIMVLAGVVAFTVLAAVMWGLRTPDAPLPAEANKPNVERVSRAEGLATLPRDYASIPKPPQLGAPIGELGRSVVRAEREAGLPQLPERSNFRPDPEEDARRAQRLKDQSEAEEAARGSVFFQLKNTHRNSAPPGAPVTGDQSLLGGDDSVLRSRANQAGQGHADEGTDPNGQNAKHAFLAQASDSRLYASASLRKPPSPYLIKAGWLIPAALQTGVNSDLPGQVTAVVTENVFDSATGQFLLIPQGSTLLGEYDSRVAFGQRRNLVVWTRLTLPDDSAIELERLPASDPQGYAGLEDGVDWHWKRLFAGAALSTVLGAGAELAAPESSGSDGRVVVATRESIQESVNQVGQDITRRNLDIQPTLTNRPGLPLRVIVNRDLILKPYLSKEAS